MDRNSVTMNPDVLFGTPVFGDTLVPVQTLFDYLKEGESVESFLQDFPSVAYDQVERVLEIATFFLQWADVC